MAYQNVTDGSVPRFYINNFEWMHSQGIMEDAESFHIEDFFTINPNGFHEHTPDNGDGHNDVIILPKFTGIRLDQIIGTKGFVAVLGHNFASRDAIMVVHAHDGGSNYPGTTGNVAIINNETMSGWGDSIRSFQGLYDGFSIYTCNFANFTYVAGWNYNGANNADIRIRFDSGALTVVDNSAYNGTSKIGFSNIVIGSFYDMPHSPELKLTMTREMDGVKRVRTKGGNDLVHHKYLKSPNWGYLPPWELDTYAANPVNAAYYATSRVGRRSWDLSFNYMQGSDMFGSFEMLSQYSDGYYPVGYGTDMSTYQNNDDASIVGSGWRMNYNLLTDDNFFSQVIHKTNGGQLPFIFNPAGGGTTPNNNPDMFAICKLDMKSFKFDQISPGLYRCRIKIREVW